MKKYKLLTILVLPSLLLINSSCDNRGNGGGITGPSYTLDVSPFVDETTPDEEVQMRCLVLDGFGDQTGGVMVKFEALDFGYVTPEMESDSDEEDGLNGTVYFDPQGGHGVNRIRVWSEEVNVSMPDTAEILVSWYNLDFELEHVPVLSGEDSQIYCRVFNPVNGIQTGDIRIRFLSLNFGEVPPNLTMSSATSFSGLQSTVFYEAPADTFGTAVLIANAMYTSVSEIVMGSDTLIVNVVEN